MQYAARTYLVRALTADGIEAGVAIFITAEGARRSADVIAAPLLPAATTAPPRSGCCAEDDAAAAAIAGVQTLARTSKRPYPGPRPPLDGRSRRTAPLLHWEFLPLPPPRAPCQGGCAISDYRRATIELL